MSSYLIPGEGKNSRLAYNSTYYTQLLLEDPSNPHSLLSSAYPEMDKDDFNANGNTDELISLGCHIINAAPVKLNFLDSSGTELQPSQALTGETADGTQLTNYLVSQTPMLPVEEFLVNNPNPSEEEELAFMNNFFTSTFYTSGHTFSYALPAISGIAPTPASYTGQLTSGLNETTFTYATSSADTTTPGDTTSSDNTSGGLAETGVDLKIALSFGLLLVLAAAAVISRKF